MYEFNAKYRRLYIRVYAFFTALKLKYYHLPTKIILIARGN